MLKRLGIARMFGSPVSYFLSVRTAIKTRRTHGIDASQLIEKHYTGRIC